MRVMTIIAIVSIAINILQYTSEEAENPTFVWNDDIEGIPPDNTPILLEFTEKDTIYICNLKQ